MANYILLERIELNANTASVTFANIPQTGYTDLKLVMSSRASVTDSSDPYDLIFTLNSTSTIASKVLRGNGSVVSSNSITDRILRAGPVPSNWTANTFSNGEIYIPNYAGSNYKSWSSDAVTENNATSADMSMVAGLTSITAAITSITLAPNAGSFVQYSTFSLYGVAAVGTTPAIAPKASGGNIIDTDGTYWIHTFNTSGTFTPLVPLTCDYLVVAGGGGGGATQTGSSGGGGGGAGGYRTSIGGSLLSLGTSAVTVTVGAGGAGRSTFGKGNAGNNSVFDSITSAGGGGGAVIGGTSYGYPVGGENGESGGSGGGSAFNFTTFVAGTGGAGNTPSTSPSQGNNGGVGNGSPNNYGTGGGGGAGGVGGNGTSSTGGAGGAGTANSISGSSVTYSGGGGGSTFNGGTGGTGGAGGGGNGGTGNAANATAGTANTGGGGGGNNNLYASAAGGSGVVIIRYAV
jgi:hypothetical protein